MSLLYLIHLDQPLAFDSLGKWKLHGIGQDQFDFILEQPQASSLLQNLCSSKEFKLQNLGFLVRWGSPLPWNLNLMFSCPCLPWGRVNSLFTYSLQNFIIFSWKQIHGLFPETHWKKKEFKTCFSFISWISDYNRPFLRQSISIQISLEMKNLNLPIFVHP